MDPHEKWAAILAETPSNVVRDTNLRPGERLPVLEDLDNLDYFILSCLFRGMELRDTWDSTDPWNFLCWIDLRKVADVGPKGLTYETVNERVFRLQKLGLATCQQFEEDWHRDARLTLKGVSFTVRNISKITSGATKAHPELKSALEDQESKISNIPAHLDGEVRGYAESDKGSSVLVAPTIYPLAPHSTVIVANSLSLTISAQEVANFKGTINQLLSSLKSSNEIAGDVRQQIEREILAGVEIVQSPKPNKRLLEILLLRPLRYIAEKAAGASIGHMAVAALEWLARYAGLS
jgi:hypothetical protein